MADDVKTDEAGDARQGRPPRGYYGLPVLKTPVWRWEVWSYFFLGGLAAGSFVVASLARLFGDEHDRPVIRAGFLISFVSVLACPVLLIKDLGRPSRFLNMLRVVKPESPMSMGVWGLLGFSACSALAVLREVFGDRQGLVGAVVRLVPDRPVAVMGSGLGAFLGGYTGVLLSVTSVPLWSRSRLLGPAFLASAFSSGLAAVTFALSLRGRSSQSSLDKLERAKLAAMVGEAAALVGYLRETDRAAQPLVDPSQYGRPFVLGSDWRCR
jgi:formate-dependent nitrite reductase membrane component NrfD